MKKYKKMAALFSPIKIALSALCCAGISVAAYLLYGIENRGTIIFGWICITLLVFSIFAALPLGYSYSYRHSYVELSYLSAEYRKIYYDKYAAVLISNASYNNGLGYGAFVNIPMQYKSKGAPKTTKTTYPFLTLLKSDYPIEKAKAGMYSRDLLLIDSPDIYCLGICWPGSLGELIQHKKMPVYILEDVYLRFKGMFDEIFSDYSNEEEALFVVTNQIIPYRKYLGS